MKQTPATKNYQMSSAEIPTLLLEISKGTADFQTEHLVFQASGWTAQEAQQGLDFLVSRYLAITEHKGKEGTSNARN